MPSVHRDLSLITQCNVLPAKENDTHCKCIMVVLTIDWLLEMCSLWIMWASYVRSTICYSQNKYSSKDQAVMVENWYEDYACYVSSMQMVCLFSSILPHYISLVTNLLSKQQSWLYSAVILALQESLPLQWLERKAFLPFQSLKYVTSSKIFYFGHRQFQQQHWNHVTTMTFKWIL